MTRAVISTFPREWFAPLDWKSELSPQAREALRMAYECLAETLDMVVTPELMTIWSSHRKASTVNGYANSFRLWDRLLAISLSRTISLECFWSKQRLTLIRRVNGLRLLRPYAQTQHISCIDVSLWPSLMSSIRRR